LLVNGGVSARWSRRAAVAPPTPTPRAASPTSPANSR